MFQISVTGAEKIPGEITNPPDHNKKVHLKKNYFCTLVHKPVIL